MAEVRLQRSAIYDSMNCTIGKEEIQAIKEMMFKTIIIPTCNAGSWDMASDEEAPHPRYSPGIRGGIESSAARKNAYKHVDMSPCCHAKDDDSIG